MPQRLANLDLHARLDVPRPVARGLEHEHDRAPEEEAAHLLRLRERLPAQHGARAAVRRLCVRPRWRAWPALVRAQVLSKHVSTCVS
jgi:hypothetical protein